MVKVNESTRDQLLALAKAWLNVLITGSHGVGKTELCIWIAEQLGIKYKYLSCATLDPWVDFVGLPVPKGDELKFLRSKDLMEAEWFILDEINRSHPKVQNASLEMIQRKSINGVRLPKLKMVWGLQNPPTKLYQCTALDPAMVTRFQANITLTANPSADYLAEKFSSDILIDKILKTDTTRMRARKEEENEKKQKVIDHNKSVAKALVEWWTNDLSGGEGQEMVPPRILEYLGTLITKKLDWQFALGDSLGVPLWGLENRLTEHCGISKFENITLVRMCDSLAEYMEKVKTERDFAIHVVSEAKRSKTETNWDAAEILLAMPQEFQNTLFGDDKWNHKMLNYWPNLDHSFHDSDECRQLKKALVEISSDDEDNEDEV